jgi:hypothetical protein
VGRTKEIFFETSQLHLNLQNTQITEQKLN